jgi:ATP-dependent Clp protease ATP-binding subunit ClpB
MVLALLARQGAYMIRFDKFTQKAQEAIQEAQTLAEQNQHQAIHAVHLLLALASEKDGVVRPVLEKCGAQPEAILQEAERALQDIPKVTGAQPGAYVSPSLNEIVDRA